MKTCDNCEYSEPIGGGLACMGQKGMPFVKPTDSCERWRTVKQINYDRIISKTQRNWQSGFAKCKNEKNYKGKIICLHFPNRDG